MAKNLQTVARRALTPCAADDAFQFADGSRARDLAMLRHGVQTKSTYLVEHHRHDFAPWIERTLGDPALARRVERVSRRRLPGASYQRDLLGVLDERFEKLQARVV